jgi:hypothetical protein
LIDSRKIGFFLVLSFVALAQESAPQRVIGQVVTAAGAEARLEVKSDDSKVWTLTFDETSRFQRVAPGEKDLSKAQSIKAKDIAIGDRILARGLTAQQPDLYMARSLIVISHSDLAAKEAKEHADWAKRGAGGLVKTVDPAAGEISVQLPSMGAPRMLTVKASGQTQYRRYAPDSVRFADAKSSSLADIRPGDQLRVLGNRSEDGATIQAEQVLSGLFRTVAGAVTALRPEKNELEIKDVTTGKTLLIHVTDGSLLKRLPPRPAGAAPPSGGGPPGGGRFDIQRMIERLPQVPLTDIKSGETIIVSSTRGNKADELTAITVVAGADFLLAMAGRRQTGGQRGSQSAESGGTGSWNLDIPMMPIQ